MAENTKAGVEIIERSFSQRIEQSSITSFMTVGAYSKGPVNEAIRVESRKQLIDVFGAPDDINYKYFFPVATMLDATNSVWIARVEGGEVRCPGITVGEAQLAISGSFVHPDGAVEANDTVKITNTPQTALYPLTYGSLQEVSAGTANVPALSGGFYDESEISNQISVFAVGPGTLYNNVGFAMLNRSDYDLLQDLQAELSETFSEEDLLTLGQTTYNTASSGGGVTLEIVEDIIDPSNNYKINVATLNQYLSFEYGPSSDDQFAFYEYQNGNLIANWIVSVDRDGKDTLGQNIFINNVVENGSNNLRVLAGTAENTAKDIVVRSVAETALPGGDALTTDLGDLTDDFIIQLNNNYGSSLGIQGNAIIDLDFPTPVKQRIDTICQSRKNCIGILAPTADTMINLSTNQKTTKPTKLIKEYVNGTLKINSSYSAIYANFFEVYDEFNDKKRWIPCTGHIANRMAFTFDNFDPWWAFAGFERGIIPSGVLRVAYTPSDEQQKVLYTNRINPIVDFSTEGVVIMGQKTLQATASNTDRLNVRNLYIKIARDIARFSNFVLFAPNDELTRAQWRTQVNNYLNGIFQRRGILEYKVVCDDSNNPAEVVARNEFVGWLLIRPTPAAEFVKITIADVGGTLSFDEVIQGGGV
jgi:hypothetical protein